MDNEENQIDPSSRCACKHKYAQHGAIGCQAHWCQCDEFQPAENSSLVKDKHKKKVIEAAVAKFEDFKEKALQRILEEFQAKIAGESDISVEEAKQIIKDLGEDISKGFISAMSVEYDLLVPQFYMDIIRNPFAKDTIKVNAAKELKELLGKVQKTPLVQQNFTNNTNHTYFELALKEVNELEKKKVIELPAPK